MEKFCVAIIIFFGIYDSCHVDNVRPLVKGAMSVKQLDEGIYFLEFSGNDGFDEFLDRGGAADASDLGVYIAEFISRGFLKQPAAKPQKQDFGCSTMAVVTTDGTRLMGRNFDWQNCQCIISKVNPKGGYRYISAFNPDFFGFGPGWKPERFTNQYLALATLFAALDGVNEKGLAVADLTAGENSETHQNNGKPDLTTTCAIKYLLKSAASVDEAVTLLEGIDFHSDIGNLHHLSISDASGRTAFSEVLYNQQFIEIPSAFWWKGFSQLADYQPFSNTAFVVCIHFAKA